MDSEIVPQNQEFLALVEGMTFPDLDEKGFDFPEPLVIRKKIARLEELMLKADGIQVQIKTVHRWSNGVYTREVFIPKGTLVMGRIHRHECVAIMSKGDKTTLSEDGVKRLKAPFSCISKPGMKRVGFAHEDSVWTTVHATGERDLATLEKELFVDSFDEVAVKPSDSLVFENLQGFM